MGEEWEGDWGNVKAALTDARHAKGLSGSYFRSADDALERLRQRERRVAEAVRDAAAVACEVRGALPLTGGATVYRDREMRHMAEEMRNLDLKAIIASVEKR